MLENSSDIYISNIYRNLEFFRRMIALSRNPYQRAFYESIFYNKKNNLYYLQQYQNFNYYHHNHLNEIVQPNQREFTLAELAQYDGADGRAAYVAVNGSVYDVSLEATWGGGLATALNEIVRVSHMGIHLIEESIPILKEVKSINELLGLDPLYLPCEGRMIIVVDQKESGRILDEIRQC